jgi:hypothetical protein
MSDRLPPDWACLLRATGACALVAGVAFAQAVPLPPSMRSVVARREQVAAYTQPDERAERRGTLLSGAKLPALGRALGMGCGGAFVQIAPGAYVCERDVVPSAEAPEVRAPLGSREGGLPYEYMQVGEDGTRGYATPADHLADEYATAFGAGFTLAVAARVKHDGVAFVRTRGGYYVLERALRPVSASAFAGVQLGPGELARVGWVVRDGAAIDDTHSGRMLRSAPRLLRVEVRGERPGGQLALGGSGVLGGGGVLGFSDGGVIDARAVRRPALHAPPARVGAHERWIDVDLARQVLVAYEGATPVFATLISSGRERAGARTPRGAFRIWVKLQSSDMRDHEAYELERSYAIEQVPWVQYFEQGYGLHAAFWHDRFGEPHSRGCINLSPRDARWLFEFTAPVLPLGWFAVRPAAGDPGTWVVVR